MFPYPEHYRLAAPPVLTFFMVMWSLLGHWLIGDGNWLVIFVLGVLFPIIMLLHLHLVFITEGMKRLDQAFYGLIHCTLAFVVWTFCFMLISGKSII
ncbi:hypothetical protein JYB87_03035 [Shewanella avicenniae]|uniref:Uncharacterized protein n=1 Tax=Shewanella avicenniae TaxID=2814294 RepID=A0ABX7QTC6_9GAMM|nr:hypothetical protein [Shewanella avicenniae]QSX34240.1 hypothetical protein JYB87_03035 [Shewanella avicenniae]